MRGAQYWLCPKKPEKAVVVVWLSRDYKHEEQEALVTEIRALVLR